MQRLRVLTKLKPLEITGIFLFLFSTVLVSVILKTGATIYAYMEISDSIFKTISFTLGLIFHLPALYGVLGATLIVLLGLLLGLNIVLLIQYTVLKRSLTEHKPKISAVHSVTGLIATVLGIGCAACGSAILLSVLSIFGASSLILFLPLHGNEFGIIGLLILSASNWLLLEKLNNPYICDI